MEHHEWKTLYSSIRLIHKTGLGNKLNRKRLLKSITPFIRTHWYSNEGARDLGAFFMQIKYIPVSDPRRTNSRRERRVDYCRRRAWSLRSHINEGAVVREVASHTHIHVVVHVFTGLMTVTSTFCLCSQLISLIYWVNITVFFYEAWSTMLGPCQVSTVREG